MNIYTDKGLTRYINLCVGLLAVFMVVMAVMSLTATLGG
jgi:hypothetical protein